MSRTALVLNDKIVYCACPECKIVRKRVGKKFNIIKKGYERNGLARFFCLGCGKWFNERTGESMRWQERF